MEYFVVTFSKIENTVVKRSDVLNGIGVRRWPFIIIELVVKDFTIEKSTNQDALFYQNTDIFQKEKRTDVVVLVLDNVFNDVSNCPDLIIFQSAIDS